MIITYDQSASICFILFLSLKVQWTFIRDSDESITAAVDSFSEFKSSHGTRNLISAKGPRFGSFQLGIKQLFFF